MKMPNFTRRKKCEAFSKISCVWLVEKRHIYRR